ncbi:T-cell surface glycoprotein CD8 beta chain [Lycodopsis pacificus]
MVLPLAWTLLTASLWTLGSSQILQREPVKIRYPEILSTEAIECDCTNISCDSVYWFRSIQDHRKLEFLGKCNNADRAYHGHQVDKTRFKLNKQSMSFMLRIINVTENDTGIYSCVLKDRQNTEMWKPGILLRPGVIPPTSAPLPKAKPKPPVKPVCRCPTENPSPDGCGSLVLWPSVGLVTALALALICTLYYFSRLPKKCRHHSVKR